MRDLAIGALAGLAGGAALCVLLARALENVGAVNAITTGVSIGLIAATGIAAAFLPALRHHARASGRRVTKLRGGAAAPPSLPPARA